MPADLCGRRDTEAPAPPSRSRATHGWRATARLCLFSTLYLHLSSFLLSFDAFHASSPLSASRDLEQHVAVGGGPVAALLPIGLGLRQLRLERGHLPEEGRRPGD